MSCLHITHFKYCMLILLTDFQNNLSRVFDIFCCIEKWQLFACIGSDKQAQLRPRPKEPFGLGAKAERPKLMRCISKKRAQEKKRLLLLAQENKTFSSFLMDWYSHGQKFAPNLMKHFYTSNNCNETGE